MSSQELLTCQDVIQRFYFPYALEQAAELTRYYTDYQENVKLAERIRAQKDDPDHEVDKAIREALKWIYGYYPQVDDRQLKGLGYTRTY
uniref:Uncharacterized protein n=1 Tax=Moniliophthora roreri TaxID=221103 RepID=A0A0W0G3A7_MONRR